MSSPAKDLQIASAAALPLTREQKRFNSLLRQLDKARITLKAWQDNLAPFRQSCLEVLLPLQNQLATTVRQWILALDGQLDQKGWSRSERQLLRQELCDAAVSLLELHADDAEIRALHDKHAERVFDAEKRDELLLIKGFTEAMTGIDLGDNDFENSEELFRRMSEQLAEHEARDVERAAKRRRRPKSAAQTQREEQVRQAAQSIREIYRKLASALHPDRESDPAERQRKTALLQKVNGAYDKSDLLTLLEVQLEIEQLDAKHLAEAGAERLLHYNRVLAEQLDELRAEIQRFEFGVRAEMSLDPGAPLRPDRLGSLIEERAHQLRADLAELKRRLHMLEDRVATRLWIRKERQARREAESFDPFDPFGIPY